MKPRFKRGNKHESTRKASMSVCEPLLQDDMQGGKHIVGEASMKPIEEKIIYTKNQFDSVFRLRKQGLNYKQISDITKIKYHIIRGWLVYCRAPYNLWSEARKKEYKTKLSTAQKRRRHSKETKQKISLSHLEKLNPMWKGDKASLSSARERAQRLYGKECPNGYEIHHIDGNPYNNKRDNIDFVTRKQHMERDGRLNVFLGPHKRGGRKKFKL